jgi:hypothetical protein
MTATKINATVKYINCLTFAPYHVYGEPQNMYIFKDEENNKTYIWKTTTQLQYNNNSINKGATINIIGNYKGEKTYKGEQQTILTRVKVNSIVNEGLTKEQYLEIKRNEQLEQAEKNDCILYHTTYKAYKQHYSDCETLINSFNKDTCTITVIVPNDRMKNSGVRGQRFAYYLFYTEDKKHCRCKYAVCAENARKQLEKEIKKENGFLPSIDNWYIESVDVCGKYRF